MSPDAPVLAWESAQALARKGRKAQSAGNFADAYLYYSQAAAADPRNKQYWVLSQALRTRAMQSSPALALASQPAPPLPADSDDSNPPNEPNTIESTIDPMDMQESRRPLPPKEFNVPEGHKDFDLRGDARRLFSEVMKRFGLDVVFDGEYPAGAPVHFVLQDVDFRTAIASLQAATSSFVVPLSDRVGMVYKDTQQKRNESEPTVAVTISLPNPVSVQEAQELARAVQQVIEIQKFAIDSGQRLVLIKDRVSKVRVAQTLYQQMLTHRPQVMVEVEVLDMQEKDDLSFGAILPTTTALSFLGHRAGTGAAAKALFRVIPDFVPGFTKFLMLGGGYSTIALAISDASLFASSTKSRSQSLYRTQIRSVDGMPATLHIGDKYPIVTQQFQGSAGISALATPSTFQFEDLGLTLKITSRVHDGEEVSMLIEAEFKLLGSGKYNGIPVISNRKFTSMVRLRNGESGILAGLVNSTEAKSVSGLPFLSQLPLLSQALSQNTRSKQKGEALVVITPRIIDSAAADYYTPSIYTGTESRWVTLH